MHKKIKLPNNCIMTKIGDKIILDLIIFVGATMWLWYLLEKLVDSIIISLLITILIKVLYTHFFNRHKNKKTINSAEMMTIFAIMGTQNTAKHMLPLFPQTYEPTVNGEWLTYKKDKTILILIAYKMADISAEDVLKAYRKAKELNLDSVKILGRGIARNTIIFANSLDIKFEFVEKKIVFKLLFNHNALPAKNFNTKRIKQKIDFRTLFFSVATRKKAKLYLSSGFVLALMSLFTPLKIYYLCLASVSFALGIASLLQHSD